MYKLKLFVFSAAFLFSIHLLTAQPNRGYYTVGVSVGALNYSGDLVRNKDLWKFTRPGIGIMGSYRFSPFISGRLSFLHGTLTADDGKSSDEILQRRNLSFKSPVTELSAVLTFEFIPTESFYYRRAKFSPYVFGGISLFHYNPKAKLDGKWYELKPLGTEGQFLTDPDNRYPDPYRLVSLAIPMGVGLRFQLTQNLDLYLETGYRKTYTDYLDDASTFYPAMDDLRAQNPVAFLLSDRSDRSLVPEGLSSRPNSIRANSGTDDGYFYTSVTIGYILDFVRCPTFK